MFGILSSQRKGYRRTTRLLGSQGDITFSASVFEVVKIVKTKMVFKYIHEDFMTEMVWTVREMTESNHAKYTAFISNSN